MDSEPTPDEEPEFVPDSTAEDETEPAADPSPEEEPAPASDTVAIEPSDNEAESKEEDIESSEDVEGEANEEDEDEANEKDEEEEDEDEEEKSGYRWILWLLGAILLGALCFAGGYYTGKTCSIPFVDSLLTEQKPEVKETEVIPLLPVDTDSIAADTLASDSMATAPAVDSVAATAAASSEPVAASSAPAANPAPAAATPAPVEKVKSDASEDYKKYEAMDVRVRTGAYRIVGLDKKVKVKKGETLLQLARRHYGAPEMVCYIEVYNGFNAKTTLKEGQEVRLPKLVWKKKKSN